MRLRIKKSVFLEIVIMTFLFLAGLNFKNQYYYFLMISVVLVIFERKNIKVDGNFIALCILAAAMLIFSPMTKNKITSMIKPFLYPMAYCAGLSFCEDDYEAAKTTANEKRLLRVIIILSLAPFTHYVLNWINNLNFAMGRNTIDIWTGSIASATIQAAMACMMVGVVGCVIFADYPIRVKIYAMLMIAAILAYNMVLAGRMLIVLIFLIGACSFLFSFSMQKEKSKKQKTIATVIVIMLAVYIIYSGNFFGIRERIEGSNLYARFFGNYAMGIMEDGRGAAKFAYLQNFPKGLWGGCQIRQMGIGYAHDILLDTYDEGGLLALLGIAAFVIGSVKTWLGILKNDIYSMRLKQMLFSVYLAIYVVFALEPVLQGAPWLFSLFCFIHGMTVRLGYEKNKRIEANGNERSFC